MAGLSTEGIKFKVKANSETSYTALSGLQSVPQLGGSFTKLDVTTLSDSQEKFIKGIKTLKDMTFGFLYDRDQTPSSYDKLKTIEDAGTVASFEVEYPDGSKFDFTGYVSLSIDAAKVKGVLSFTATIITNSDITLVDDNE